MVISYDFKKEVKEQDIAPLIYSINVSDKGITMVIAAGNPNLRPDRLINVINEKFSLSINISDIVRTKQLVIENNKILTAEEFLREYIK